jgi:membrane peptidoglycan carboxypeptidase
MDLILPKDRILELYLNCIEWGRGIFGIGAAAAYHYDSSVGNLGLDEMRRLVTIISNPLRYDVTTFFRSRQMAARYAYLVSRFPDPSAEPSEPGRVAPIPDAPETEIPPTPPLVQQ